MARSGKRFFQQSKEPIEDTQFLGADRMEPIEDTQFLAKWKTPSF
jgi:hypothetical protein